MKLHVGCIKKYKMFFKGDFYQVNSLRLITLTLHQIHDQARYNAVNKVSHNLTCNGIWMNKMIKINTK